MSIRFLAAAALAMLLAGGPTHAQQAGNDAKPRQFVYMLRLAPKYQQETAWTDADRAAVGRHFQRLADGVRAGQVILAGKSDEPLDRTFGIVVFEAPDEAAARAFMEGDPAVAAGIMQATLHPYSVALIRK